MTDNGQGYLFVEGSILINVLVKVLEAIEVIRKILLTQHYTCLILLDCDLHLDYFLMQNYPVTRE